MVHSLEIKKKKKGLMYFCIFAVLVNVIFSTALSLPDIYSASQGLKVVSMVCNASSFAGGKPIPICPSGVYHAAEKPRGASLQLQPRPQNTRVGPLWPVKRFWSQSRGEETHHGLRLAAYTPFFFSLHGFGDFSCSYIFLFSVMSSHLLRAAFSLYM